MKLPVSVCILVKNEADRLPRCLPHLDIFEEVVIGDTGSRDNSRELCRSYGAKVYDLPWKGFGATRRHLFSLAKQPWVLWLDADEIISSELKSELTELFQGNGPSCQAYRLNRIMNFFGRWVHYGNWFPDWNVRLFHRDAWEMDDALVHEKVTTLGEVGDLAGLLEHYSYRSPEDRQSRMKYYAKLWAEERHRAGESASHFKIFWHTAWTFIRGYFLKQGFRDGALGFEVAWLNCQATMLKYRTLQQMGTQPKPTEPAPPPRSQHETMRINGRPTVVVSPHWLRQPADKQSVTN